MLSALFGRGYSRLGIVLGLINILVFAKVWQETFEELGIPIAAVIVSIPLVFVVVCVIVGYIEKEKNVWGTELIYTWKIAGYDPIQLTKDVSNISAWINSQKDDGK